MFYRTEEHLFCVGNICFASENISVALRCLSVMQTRRVDESAGQRHLANISVSHVQLSRRIALGPNHLTAYTRRLCIMTISCSTIPWCIHWLAANPPQLPSEKSGFVEYIHEHRLDEKPALDFATHDERLYGGSCTVMRRTQSQREITAEYHLNIAVAQISVAPRSREFCKFL